MYDFRGSFSRKCTVKIPAKYLEMSDDEILKENSEVAIKALEEQRKAIEDRIINTNKPLHAEIDKINMRIETLKGMVVKDENV